jgi:hypothetical protein
MAPLHPVQLRRMLGPPAGLPRNIALAKALAQSRTGVSQNSHGDVMATGTKRRIGVPGEPRSLESPFVFGSRNKRWFDFARHDSLIDWDIPTGNLVYPLIFGL